VRLVPTCVAFALGLAVVACNASPRTFGSADQTAITAVLHAQQDAWNRGDLDGFMTGYAHSPDLVFTSGGNIRRGWQDTYDKYRAKYGSDRSGMGHLDFDVLGIQPLGADGAIVLGRWQLTETPNAGSGVFSLGFARTDAGWHIVHDHTSLGPVDSSRR
jgi:ketosteroid isomerase-like protein